MQQFSTGGHLSSRGHEAVSGDTFHFVTWWLLQAEGVEARNAAKLPTVHRTAPTTKNYLVQNANSANVEEQGYRAKWVEIGLEKRYSIFSMVLC